MQGTGCRRSATLEPMLDHPLERSTECDVLMTSADAWLPGMSSHGGSPQSRSRIMSWVDLGESVACEARAVPC